MPHYWITSSAATSTLCGKVRPSALEIGAARAKEVAQAHEVWILIAMGIAVGLCRGGSPADAVRGQVLRVCGEAWVKIDISKGSQDRDSSVPRRGWPAPPASLSFPSRGERDSPAS